MNETARYFHCILMLSSFRPRIVPLLGSVRSVQSTMKGMRMSPAVLIDWISTSFMFVLSKNLYCSNDIGDSIFSYCAKSEPA